MREIAVRELRNNTNAMLRDVEQGETVRITVSGRPVADLVPLPQRRRFMSWDELRGAQADAGLATELEALFPDTTDDEELA